MLGHGHDKSAPTPCGVFVGYFVCECGHFAVCFVVCFVGVRCVINNPFAAKWLSVRSRRGRFIVPAYTYSPRIRNLFEMYSRNVRNVFIICMLHNRHSKAWFLHCKSMVFGVQKGGFWRAKVWFL